MEKELKHCPFCVSTDVYIPNMEHRQSGVVVCCGCGVIVGRPDTTELETVNMWNRRAEEERR